MADTRFSREDYERLARFHEDRCRAAGPHQPPECSYCETAAALRDAANRAPTHAELSDRLRMLDSYEATEAMAAHRMTPTPEPGAPQQDGPTSQSSAPAEGASGERGSTP